jgi:flagellar basal-body rod protein FlgF
MFRGLYTATAGMISQQRRQEMLSNNLANVNTPGYKADQASLRAFPEMLLHQIGGTGSKSNVLPRVSSPIGELSTGVYMQETLPNFIQGDLQETGNRMDLALLQGTIPVDEETGESGVLFFLVANEQGESRLTRNGRFTVDSAGNLVTNQGEFLLSIEGERIQVNSERFTVRDDGSIEEDGLIVAQLDVALVDNPNSLVKEGNGLYRFDVEEDFESAVNNPDVTYQLQQGFIERSNVNTEETMVKMLNAYRGFEANQKVIQAYDRSMDKAVNEVGKIG